jgi:hypothetical protein
MHESPLVIDRPPLDANDPGPQLVLTFFPIAVAGCSGEIGSLLPGLQGSREREPRVYPFFALRYLHKVLRRVEKAPFASAFIASQGLLLI